MYMRTLDIRWLKLSFGFPPCRVIWRLGGGDGPPGQGLSKVKDLMVGEHVCDYV